MSVDVTRPISHRSWTVSILLVAVVCTSGVALAQEHPAAELRGRLATVEPASRRLTIVPDGASERVELFLGDQGQLEYEERQLTLTDLVIQVGRRVAVYYRVDDGARRIIERLIVEPD